MNTKSTLCIFRDSVSLALMMLIGAVVGGMFLIPFMVVGEPGDAAARVIAAAVVGALMAAIGFKIHISQRIDP